MIQKIMLSMIALVILSPAYAFAAPGTIAVDLDGISVDVSYDADGVEVLSVQSDLEFISLLFQVKVTGSPGILEITLDRNFLDATFEGVDDEFFIITDGFDEPTFEEVETTSELRTLRIVLAPGTEDLEIFGTVFGEPESAPEEVTEEPETVVEEPEEVTEEPETVVEEPEEVTEPKTQCGPGTVLKNGVCVLEDKCGPGTVLQDGVCVLTASSSTSGSIVSRDFIVGAGAALGIALLLIIIFAAIGRANREKQS
ncbi:MAG: hypothetical protein IIA81_00870 [Thaumarchaeota archaeon]|nr:hypothetical protein [Nitrososphaerota archaeon]